jgi:YcaO cyclodehydratase, ATP-ad Mg2+-binding
MNSPSLDDLSSAYPLPKEWSRPSLVEDTVVADGLELRRTGITSTGPLGEEMVGSAADCVTSPLDRAYFELLERISTVEAIGIHPPYYDLRTLDGRGAGRRPSTDVFRESDDPARWRPARSNGVAVHVDWKSASLRAFWELCERDRVLRAWYGEVAPQQMHSALDSSPLARARSYEWLAYAFPETARSRFSKGVHVCGVFGLPKTDAPFIFGYAARRSLEDAQLGAEREASQLLAFLWGEDIPKADPPFSPTPLYHLETFQRLERQRIVRSWLEGAHVANATPSGSAAEDSEVLFVDLTPTWLRGLCVSKAVCSAAVPLTFGDGPFGAHLPVELRVHPIA